jgi:ketosteroid isomerase-like protein
MARVPHWRLTSWTLVALLVVSCTSREEQLARDKSAIIEGNQYYIGLHVNEEVDKLMELYEEDGMLLPPGREPVAGKSAIRAEWESLFAQFDIISAESVMDEVLVSGDLAYERGHYKVVMHDRVSGEETIEQGRFSGILRRGSDGKWRTLRDMYN